MKYFSLFFLFLYSCGAISASRTELTHQGSIEEVRIALLDVRHSLSAQQMDISLLEEKVEKKGQPLVSGQLSLLEKKMLELEKKEEKLHLQIEEVKTEVCKAFSLLSALEACLASQKQRLDEVVKLKATLQSISEVIGHKGSQEKVHKVIAGDSLEKLARDYNKTVESIKKANGLTSSTIFAGQELTIP